jgi:hypothetical protein
MIHCILLSLFVIRIVFIEPFELAANARHIPLLNTPTVDIPAVNNVITTAMVLITSFYGL